MKKGHIALFALVFLIAGSTEAFAQNKRKPRPKKPVAPSVSTPALEPCVEKGPVSEPASVTDDPVSVESGVDDGKSTGVGKSVREPSRLYLDVDLEAIAGSGVKNVPDSAKPDAPCEPSASTPLVITYKPSASYTDKARTENVQGTVRLRVTFLPSGQIGAIAPVSGLPYGLTEQATAAARQIKFKPATKNGVPQRTVKVVVYTFTIY